MLGGRITNQDEEEVEDELAALEREVNGPGVLPAVPNTSLSPSEEVADVEEEERQPEVRAQEERRPERQAMLAS